MKKILTDIFFTVAMVVMAVLLTVAAAMICAVKILHPGRLTPLVEHFANKAVNADVSVGTQSPGRFPVGDI